MRIAIDAEIYIAMIRPNNMYRSDSTQHARVYKHTKYAVVTH